MSKTTAVFIRLRHSIFFLLAFIVLALTVACSSSKPPAEETAAGSGPKAAAAPAAAPHLEIDPKQKVIGSVDIVTLMPATLTESDKVEAQGWAASAVSGAPITVVALLIDGKVVAEAKTFGPRADVAAAFGRPDFENSGWKIDAPIKKPGPGKHPVTILATNAHGDKLVLPGASLTLP